MNSENAEIVSETETKIQLLKNYLKLSLEESPKTTCEKFQPPGNLIHSSDEIEVYYGSLTELETKDYYERLKIFSFFFIEGANTVDLNDDRWKMFTM